MPETFSRNRRLVITGASGFLGRTVAAAAGAAGWDVFCASRTVSPEQSPGSWWQFPPACPVDTLAEWLEQVKPDAVFHGAGSASVKASFESPMEDLQASFGSWSAWLEAARRWGGKPLMIFPSSAAVYGSPETVPVKEEAPVAPISPYGTHKLLCELLAREYHQMFQVPVVVVRLFSVFGAQQHRLLVWEVFQKILQNPEMIQLRGTGAERRDYLHESAVAEAVLLLAADRERWLVQPRLPLFNLGCGREHQVLEVADQLRQRTSPHHRIVFEGETQAGDPDRWCADISRFRAAYPQWNPVGLEEGLDGTLHHWMTLTKAAAPNLPGHAET